MGRQQWIAILLSGTIVFLLYFFGQTTYLKSEDDHLAQEDAEKDTLLQSKEKLDFSVLLEEKVASLPEQKQRFFFKQKKKLASAKTDSKRVDLLHHLGHFWEQENEPALAGFYLKQAAQLTSQSNDWITTGDRFNIAFRQRQDSLKRPLVQQAINSYKKALQLDPSNLSVQLSLATCYTDGTKEVMKGVRILLDVVEKDPSHPDANFHLGRLAIRSGQYNKARKRLKTVIEAEPNNIEARLYLGQTYLNQGEKQKAIDILKKTKNFVQDSTRKKELEQYIQKIVNS